MHMAYFYRSCTGFSDHNCCMAGDESQQSACRKICVAWLYIHGLRKSWCAGGGGGGGISALAEGVIAAAEEMRVVKDAMTARRKV